MPRATKARSESEVPRKPSQVPRSPEEVTYVVCGPVRGHGDNLLPALSENGASGGDEQDRFGCSGMNFGVDSSFEELFATAESGGRREMRGGSMSSVREPAVSKESAPRRLSLGHALAACVEDDLAFHVSFDTQTLGFAVRLFLLGELRVGELRVTRVRPTCQHFDTLAVEDVLVSVDGACLASPFPEDEFDPLMATLSARRPLTLEFRRPNATTRRHVLSAVITPGRLAEESAAAVPAAAAPSLARRPSSRCSEKGVSCSDSAVPETGISDSDSDSLASDIVCETRDYAEIRKRESCELVELSRDGSPELARVRTAAALADDRAAADVSPPPDDEPREERSLPDDDDPRSVETALDAATRAFATKLPDEVTFDRQSPDCGDDETRSFDALFATADAAELSRGRDDAAACAGTNSACADDDTDDAAANAAANAAAAVSAYTHAEVDEPCAPDVDATFETVRVLDEEMVVDDETLFVEDEESRAGGDDDVEDDDLLDTTAHELDSEVTTAPPLAVNAPLVGGAGIDARFLEPIPSEVRFDNTMGSLGCGPSFGDLFAAADAANFDNFFANLPNVNDHL